MMKLSVKLEFLLKVEFIEELIHVKPHDTVKNLFGRTVESDINKILIQCDRPTLLCTVIDLL